MYIYIFFQTSKYYPSIFCSRNIHPIFPKKNQFPFHQRFNSLLQLFLPKSPDFLSKHVNISTEFHRLSLSTLAPSLSFFLHIFVHETMHERSPICQFVIPRGCIATRYASVALHKSRTFSRPIVRVRHCTRKPQTLQPKGKE